MEQLLLVTSCDSPAGIGASLRTHARTNGWTDRRDVGNSILDFKKGSKYGYGYEIIYFSTGFTIQRTETRSFLR